MKKYLTFATTFVFGLLIVLATSMFTVDQRQWAIVFQLGEIKEVIDEPGQGPSVSKGPYV